MVSMDRNPSPLTDSARPSPSRILIAESDPSTLESLARTIDEGPLEATFHFCTSSDAFMDKALGSPYQLIICGVHLSEMNDFFLLKHNQVFQPCVPFVVTASASDRQSARRSLEYGAFDLIMRPFSSVQAMNTIREALWQNKLLALIDNEEKALQKYRQHFTVYPGDKKMKKVFRKALLAVQKTITSYEKTIQRIEESRMCFLHLATGIEKKTRERAWNRLDAAPIGTEGLLRRF